MRERHNNGFFVFKELFLFEKEEARSSNPFKYTNNTQSRPHPFLPFVFKNVKVTLRGAFSI